MYAFFCSPTRIELKHRQKTVLFVLVPNCGKAEKFHIVPDAYEAAHLWSQL
jgi:hypothetical protein